MEKKEKDHQIEAFVKENKLNEEDVAEAANLSEFEEQARSLVSEAAGYVYRLKQRLSNIELRLLKLEKDKK